MRIFTAIPLPNKAKAKVAEITRSRLPVPYVNTSNLHVTLNFLGELAEDELTHAKKIFEAFAGQYKKFLVEFDAVKKFHQQIHMTLKSNRELFVLQKELEGRFQGAGFRFQNREYYPHVKLANMHMDNIMHRERKFENFPNEELSALNFQAERIVLYESKLLLHHPKYMELSEIDLI